MQFSAYFTMSQSFWSLINKNERISSIYCKHTYELVDR